MRALATVIVALALGACGDDDKKTDTADATDTSTTEVTTDASTGTETTTDATTPEDTEVTTTDATAEDGDATTTNDTEVVEPPQTFPEFVIELIEDHTADDTEPVSYTTFSTLTDDATEGVFDGLFD